MIEKLSFRSYSNKSKVLSTLSSALYPEAKKTVSQWGQVVFWAVTFTGQEASMRSQILSEKANHGDERAVDRVPLTSSLKLQPCSYKGWKVSTGENILLQCNSLWEILFIVSSWKWRSHNCPQRLCRREVVWLVLYTAYQHGFLLSDNLVTAVQVLTQFPFSSVHRHTHHLSVLVRFLLYFHFILLLLVFIHALCAHFSLIKDIHLIRPRLAAFQTAWSPLHVHWQQKFFCCFMPLPKSSCHTIIFQ